METLSRSFTVEIRLFPDYDASTDDADCYDPEDIAAFERGDWSYVGVVTTITETVGGCQATYEAPGLWGIERGPYWDAKYPEGDISNVDTYVRSVANEQYEELQAAFPHLPDSQGRITAARIVESV